MKNKVTNIIVSVIAIIVVAFAFGIFNFNSSDINNGQGGQNNIKNGTYLLENKPTTLVNGLSEKEAVLGSASKITTRYFGNEATGDLNGDGVSDVAFLLTQDTGGSGIFYYIAVALGMENGYLGINALLLGDRIAPQTTEIREGMIIVNYADRNPSEPMTKQPSVGVSKYFKINGTKLVEVTL